MADDEEDQHRKAFEAAYTILATAKYDQSENEEKWVKLILKAMQAASKFDVKTDILSVVGSAYFAATNDFELAPDSSTCSVGGSIMQAFARVAMMVSLAEKITSLTEEDSLWGASGGARIVENLMKVKRTEEKAENESWQKRRMQTITQIASTLANVPEPVFSPEQAKGLIWG